jgi:hypothetical protein
MVEVYARLAAEARSDFAGMRTSRVALLVGIAGKLGLSPVDRARLCVPDSGEIEDAPDVESYFQ